jgi:hypothetical protein
MVKVTAGVDLKGFLNAIETYQSAMNKSWADSIKGAGRLLAIQLGAQTQPWGGFTGKGITRVQYSKGFEAGKHAIMRDVGRVFASGSVIYDQLMMKSRAQASAYWMLMNRGQINDAERILRDNGIDAPTIKKPDESMHKSRRDRQGHILKKNSPSAVVFDEKKIDTYSRTIARRVGTAKSGWAQCADELGGTRGIAQWAKRNRSSSTGSVVDNSRSLNNPSIILQNHVRYVENLCRASAVARAVEEVRVNLLQKLEETLKKAKKEAFHQ